MESLRRLVNNKLKVNDTSLKISQETITELEKRCESGSDSSSSSSSRHPTDVPGSAFFSWLEKEVPEVENRIFALNYLSSVLGSSTENLILASGSSFTRGALLHLPSVKNSVYFGKFIHVAHTIT